VQLPVRLNQFNEPEPDLAFLKPRRDFYKSRHPGPADVFLIFEISDSSRRFDRKVKLPMYAASRIPEVWIEDVDEGVIHVLRDPARKSYQTASILRPGSMVSLLAFPDVSVSVSELLGVSE
jgi:Uma2 family endonuclease